MEAERTPARARGGRVSIAMRRDSQRQLASPTLHHPPHLRLCFSRTGDRRQVNQDDTLPGGIVP